MPFYERTEFVIVVVYLLMMIGIGFYFAARNRGGLDYFAGGRCIPWWVSGVSLYMGNFSAWLFTGGAGFLYKTTWYGLLYFLLTGSVAYFLGSQLTAARWRRSRVISPVEFTRRRFGVGTQQVLGIVTAVVFIAAAGNQLKAIATVVNVILGVPLVEAAVVIGVIVVLYTLIGGLWAVMVTDVIQFVVLLAATLLIAPLSFGLLDGGVGQMFDAMSFSIPPADGAPSHNLHFLIAGLISFTLGVASGQAPRFYCVPDEQSARKVGRLAAFLFLTTPVLFSIPPLVARAAWGGPDVLGAHVPGTDPHERVFIHIAMEVLPPGLLGVFLAAMFAATMSALDTVYNMVASILSRDMYMHFKPQTTDQGLIRVGRVMTLLCGAVTIGLCLLYVGGTSDLFKVMTDIFFLSAPVMAVPVLMGLFFRRAPRFAGMASITWGIATGVVTKFLLHWGHGPQIYLTQLLSIAIFLASPSLGRLWRTREGRRRVVVIGALAAALVVPVMLVVTPASRPVTLEIAGFSLETPLVGLHVILLFAAFLLATLVLFARRFAAPEDRTGVDAFYAQLDTPVDVATEVTGSAEAALSVFRLAGVLTAGIAVMVLVLMVIERWTHPDLSGEWGKYLALSVILLALAAAFYVGGRRSRDGLEERDG